MGSLIINSFVERSKPFIKTLIGQAFKTKFRTQLVPRRTLKTASYYQGDIYIEQIQVFAQTMRFLDSHKLRIRNLSEV